MILRRALAVGAMAAALALPALAQVYDPSTGQQKVITTGSGGGGTTSVAIANNAVTDRSGTITLGGSAQNIMAVNASRHGCSVQNQSSGDLWLSGVGTAAAIEPSIWLPAGSYFSCSPGGVPVGAISLFGATTGQAFAAREW